MPLERGSSSAVKSRNIREMRGAGYPQRQAVAAAMRMARQSRKPKRDDKRRRPRRSRR